MKLFLLGAMLPIIHLNLILPTPVLVGSIAEFWVVTVLSMLLIALSKQYEAAVAWYLSAAYSNMAETITPTILGAAVGYSSTICWALTAVYLVAIWRTSINPRLEVADRSTV